MNVKDCPLKNILVSVRDSDIYDKDNLGLKLINGEFFIVALKLGTWPKCNCE